MRNLKRHPNQRLFIHIVIFCFVHFFIGLPFYASEAWGQDIENAVPLQLISPSEKQVTLEKKPKVEVAFTRPVSSQDLFVMLDGIDITQVLEVNPNGFSYRPIGVLEPGTHTLMISGQTASGEPFNTEFVFSTRHYVAVERPPLTMS